ncbi:NifB/NifX family molybdenum-iron cluster-binding protein, partial [Methanosarcina barkeri]|uniref:NifB/NifX family molybdenum-iron cluster-binding protein n=1 Tax=Methanosarcina barkeri TaxID=2208 RepID=UPI0000386570
MAKVAIPSVSDSGLESDVCFHYVSCEYFTIVDVNDKDIESVKTVSNLSPEIEHNCAAPSKILESHNVNAVLIAGIGGKPLMSLTEKNINVFAGITEAT